MMIHSLAAELRCLMIRTADEIAPVLKRAFEILGPVVVGMHVDYRDNHKLFEMVHPDVFH